MELIDKSALVAEIERRKSQFMSQADNFHSLGMEEERDHFAVLASNMHSILSFLDTLEVKEADLDEQDIYAILYIEKEVWREYAGKDVSPVDICKEVLKRFKAQKGENI